MAEESKNQITLDMTNAVQSPKTIKAVVVQRADLEQLKWHIGRIVIPDIQFDLCSLFSGAAFATLVPFLEDVVNGSIFWLYPILSIVFLIGAATSYYCQHVKMNSDSPKHLVKELNHDIEMIYEKADIHSSGQHDQSTASDQ